MRRRDFIVGAVAASAIGRAQAQQKEKVYRIAIVSPSGPISEINETSSVSNTIYGPFLGELRRLGYVEGQNLVVERYSAEGHPERYRELVSDLIRSRPDAVFANQTQ